MLQIHDALVQDAWGVFDIAQMPTDGGPETPSPLFSNDSGLDTRYNYNAYLHGQFNRDFHLSRQIKDLDLNAVLLDDPVFFPHTLHELSRLSIPFGIVLHNMESMARIPKDTQQQFSIFHEEIAAISQSKLCVTISREETWLLENMGINCFYYPYYPTKSLEDWLSAVRSARNQSEKKYIVSLGTAFNPPTYEGMCELATMWDSVNRGKEFLIIAGFGASLIKQIDANFESIYIANNVSEDEMFTILTECKACIIHQHSGAGALTKIPELLLAGVPVIASHHAARSYYDQSSLFMYDTLEDLPTALAAATSAPPPRCSVMRRDEGLRASIARAF
ncbi:hypothetical protein [Desulfovibrio inopinatus]|uniref:hypothetical protein n=1 Tax=Desulfovibrio inopinatus TaxID=102109 RepID=UPI00042A0072|nr:hypothetical protein [Desulfovibrio inopinatus]